MSNTSTPTELYTTKTLFTLGGSSAAVWLFTTILALVFNVNTDKYKWIGLCVALAISFIGVIKLRRINIQFGTIAFFNGLLIYVTAVGIDSINQGVNRNKQLAQAALVPFTEGNAWWSTITLVDSIQYLKRETLKAIEQKENLELKNKLLSDSLSVIKNQLFSANPVQEDNNEINNCLNKNKSLQSKIYQLEKDLAAALDKTSIVPDHSQEAIGMLNALRSLNKELLKNLNQYIDAGDVKPTTQLEALRNTNENIYALKIQIDEYNSKIDALINKRKIK